MLLWWPSTKIVQTVLTRQETWPPGTGLIFPSIYIENFRNLLAVTDFNITWQECSFGDPLLRFFKQSWFAKKHGCWERGLFSLCIYIETFKILLVRHHRADFKLTWRNAPLLILYQVCSSCHNSSKNMAARRRGFFPLTIYIKHFKNLFVRNH